MNISFISFVLSSLTAFGVHTPLHLGLLARVKDNLALIGKVSASLLSLSAVIITLAPIFLIPLPFYLLTTYFWAVKMGRKGRIFVWNRPYELKDWEQRTINESSPGVYSALCASLANVSMIVLAFNFYMGTLPPLLYSP